MSREFKIELVERDESWLDGGEVAVPLEITANDDGVTAWYYPSAKSLVSEFLERFGEGEATLFSRDAVLWATEKFGAFLNEYGFELSPDSYDYYVNFALGVKQATASPDVRRLCGGEGFVDLTDTDIDGLLSGGYIVYAAVVDNKIVAVANTGETTDGEARDIEIGVDTAEKYRRHGYARACVSALASELSRLGHTAIYECASNNTASIRLAEGLGGVALYKKYYVVGFGE